MLCAQDHAALPALSLIEPAPDLPRGERTQDGSVLTLPSGVKIPLPHDSWILPPQTAEFIEKVLVHYRKIPLHIEYREEEIDKYWRVVLRSAVNTAHANERAAIGGFEWWHLAIGVVSAAIVSAAVGVIVGVSQR